MIVQLVGLEEDAGCYKFTSALKTSFKTLTSEVSVAGVQQVISRLREDNMGARTQADELAHLPREEILEIVITIIEMKPKPQRPPQLVAGVRTNVTSSAIEDEADAEEQPIDGWDCWSDGPVTLVSDNWTEQPRITTNTVDASVIRSAVEVGRARMNETTIIKKIKAAVLTPLRMACPSCTELLLLSFNKSHVALPLSLLSTTSSPESTG